MLKRSNQELIYSAADSMVTQRHVVSPPLTPPPSYKCRRLAPEVKEKVKDAMPNAFDFGADDERQAAGRKCAGTQTFFSSFLPSQLPSNGNGSPSVNPEPFRDDGDSRFVFDLGDLVQQPTGSTFNRFHRIPPPSHISRKISIDENDVPLNLTVGSTHGRLELNREEFTEQEHAMSSPLVPPTELPYSSLTLSPVSSQLSPSTQSSRDALSSSNSDKLAPVTSNRHSASSQNALLRSGKCLSKVSKESNNADENHGDVGSGNHLSTEIMINRNGRQGANTFPSDPAVKRADNATSGFHFGPRETIGSIANNDDPGSKPQTREGSLQEVGVTSTLEGIEEHFQRSLGKDYPKCVGKVVVETSRSIPRRNAAASKLNEAVAARLDQPSTVACDVDDHFAKSLGATWARLKNATDLKAEQVRADSVDDHFAKALGDTWFRIQADKDWAEPIRSRSSN